MTTGELRRTGVLGVAASVLLMAHCASTVYLNPNPALYIAAPRSDLSVGVLVNDFETRQVYSGGWNLFVSSSPIATGLALKMAAENTFARLFSKVEMLSNSDEFKSRQLTLLVTPRISRFVVLSDVTAELFLYCKIEDQNGKVLYEKTIPARGTSQAGLAYVGGGFGGGLGSAVVGQSALGTTSTEAFNSAFSMLANDIVKNVDFSPYVKK
jgi:hypothetical protein